LLECFKQDPKRLEGEIKAVNFSAKFVNHILCVSQILTIRQLCVHDLHVQDLIIGYETMTPLITFLVIGFACMYKSRWSFYNATIQSYH
jgi:hypothetical protein